MAVSNQSLLDVILEGKDESFKRKVVEIVAKTEIDPDAPIFLLLVATGRLEVMLQETPEALDKLFKNWTTDIKQAYDLVEHSLIERQKGAIAQAAGDLIRTAERQEARRFFGSLVPAAGVLLAALGFGFLAGVTVPPWLGGGYTKEVKLTANQVSALEWAESKEGQFARNLMLWNNGYLNNRACEQDAKRLNLVLTLNGRRVKEGFCTIWVVPPEQRRDVN